MDEEIKEDGKEPSIPADKQKSNFTSPSKSTGDDSLVSEGGDRGVEEKKESSLESRIESLLFVAAKPMSVKRLASLLEEKDKDMLKNVLVELSNKYKEEGRGVRIVWNEEKFQLVSAAENTDLVKKLVKDEMTGELSKPSLETLTIISYRGPISKVDLDRIRGVNCSLILKNLLMRGLVEVEIDAETDDHFYTVSLDFLKHLGVSSAKELPDYDKLHNSEVIDRVIEDEKVKENT